MSVHWNGAERRRFQIPSMPGNYPGNRIEEYQENAQDDYYLTTKFHKPKKKKRIVVLAADIRNFTKTMQDNADLAVQTFLSEFFGYATDLIQTYNGSFVNKFLGDGLLSHFPEHHEAEALCVAREIIRFFTGLKAKFKFGFANLSVAVTSADYLETSIGRESYIDYTLLGGEINSLFRLLSSTEGNLIYVSDVFAKTLTNEDSHWYVYIGVKHFKGIVEPVSCYSVIREKTDEEKKLNTATSCSKEQCPDYYDVCHRAWSKGREDAGAFTPWEDIFKLDCNSCIARNNCWNWEFCLPKKVNADEHKPTYCCHICYNFRNCFHSYQLGRQGKAMIACDTELRNLSSALALEV